MHDYHFIPLGEKIRAGGFTGAIGFFLHVPFPPPEVITTLPHAHRLVRSMLSYDVVGFQTQIDRDNFARFLVLRVQRPGDRRRLGGGRRPRGACRRFPIGIDAERFAEFRDLAGGEAALHAAPLRAARPQADHRRRPAGLFQGHSRAPRGFERLLEDYPENRNKVSLLQVAPRLARRRVQAYAELRSELEELAGHINGIYGLLDWTPVRIMTRGFARKGLAGLYRASDVGAVTPLRDGMNLVAKEYVAAQDPDDPGVLVLSRFAGAADEMHEALIVNPYDIAEVAEVLQRALQMPLEERKRRWQALNDTICKATPGTGAMRSSTRWKAIIRRRETQTRRGAIRV